MGPNIFYTNTELVWFKFWNVNILLMDSTCQEGNWDLKMLCMGLGYWTGDLEMLGSRDAEPGPGLLD